MLVPIIFTLIFGAIAVLFIFKRKKQNEEEQIDEEAQAQKLKEDKQREREEKQREREEKQREKEEAKKRALQEKKDKKNKGKTTSLVALETAEGNIHVGNAFPTSISFSKDGKYIVVACSNRNQLLFEVTAFDTKKNCIQRFKLVDDGVIDCDLIGKDKLELVLGLDRDRAIKSFYLDLKTGKGTPGKFNVKDANKFTIDSIAVAPDESFVATFGDSTYISAFTPNGTAIIRNDSHQMHNYELSVSSDSNFMALSSYTSEVVAMGFVRSGGGDILKAQKAFSVSGHKNSIRTIDFHPTKKLLATGSDDGHYAIWQTPLRWDEGEDHVKMLDKFPVEKNEAVEMVRINPSNEIVAVLTASQRLLFYKGAQKVKVIETPHTGKVKQMLWHPSGKFIAVMSTSNPFIYKYTI